MTGLGAWVAGLLLAMGPNGWWIDARLEAADDTYRDLVPMEWLGDTPANLWIVFHRRDAWVMAAYLPPDAEEMAWARAFPQVASAQFDRLLPGLEVPRLFLREGVYRVNGAAQLVDVEGLAVDSSEILYNALLDAHIDLASRRGEDWTADFGRRAEAVMTRVPEEHRAEAFHTATIDFASHVLSLAAEIARQSRRHPPERLCALLNPPRALFSSWQRTHGDAHFPGRWQRPADIANGRPGEWVITGDVLRADDKRWVIEEILGAQWSGDPALDFEFLCRGS